MPQAAGVSGRHWDDERGKSPPSAETIPSSARKFRGHSYRRLRLTGIRATVGYRYLGLFSAMAGLLCMPPPSRHRSSEAARSLHRTDKPSGVRSAVFPDRLIAGIVNSGKIGRPRLRFQRKPTVGFGAFPRFRTSVLEWTGKGYNLRHRKEDFTVLMCCGYRRVRGGEEREVHETASRAMEILRERFAISTRPKLPMRDRGR